jgi:hypothetical protein
MKKITLLLTLIFSQFCNSQCENVKKNYDELREETVFSYKYDSNWSIISGKPKNLYEITSNMVVSKGIKNNYLYLTCFSSVSMTGMKGLFIKLSNGEILRYESLHISSRYTGSNLYSSTAVIVLNDQDYQKFSELNITEFEMALFKMKIKSKDSEKIKEAISCLIKSSVL